jgi:hypothetical protein
MSDRVLTEEETMAALRRFGWVDQHGDPFRGNRRCVANCEQPGCENPRAVCARGPDHSGSHGCAACDDKHRGQP